MEAYFYNLNKRRDSTKQPTVTGTKIDLILKEGADYDYPVFQMHTDVTGYNYLKWNDHYYFITGRRFVYNSLWEISCEIDPLASCRGSIKSSSQYVLRTDVNTLADYKLIDTAYPTRTYPTIYQTKSSSSDFKLNSTGHFVLITKGKGNDGGLQYWGLNASELNSIFVQIFSTNQDSLWDDISNRVSTIIPSFLNVTDYIIGCRWMPFPLQAGDGQGRIYLGYWDSGVNGIKYSRTIKFAFASIAFGLHPETASHKLFMNCGNFRSISVYVPGCGEIPVDPAKVKTTINLKLSVDVVGNVAVSLTNGDGDIVGRLSGSLGCDIPFSGSSGVSLSAASEIGAGVGSIVSGVVAAATDGFSAAIGAVGEGLLAVGSGVAAAIPDVITKGGVAGFSVVDGCDTIVVQECVYDITDQAPTQQGYPCMKISTLGTNGYYQIKNPQVDFGDDLTIKSMIENYMRIGFYVE